MAQRYGIVTLGLLVAAAAWAQESTVDKRFRDASAVFQEIMNISDRSIPQDLLERAECIVIIPGLKKGAFVVGGKYGRGFASCRHGETWGSPSAERIEGGSFGFQIGGSSTDVILLVMNQRGMDRIASDKFTIGAEGSAAAGPVGRTASANTDVMMTAEILSWSRSRGAFAGLSLAGATLRPDDDENELLYGKAIKSKEILTNPETKVPDRARGFIATLQKYAPHHKG